MPKQKDNAPYFYRKMAGYRQSMSGAQPEPKPPASSGISFPIFDSDDATLNGLDPLIQVQLINSSSDNPAGFDLSFTYEGGGGATITDGLKATTFDNGDEFSPSYVLEAGQTRTIDLVRGPSAPSYGNTQVINVNALLPNGGTASYPVTVEGSALVSGVFSAYAPLLMLDYSSFNNEGSLKDTPLYEGGPVYPTFNTDLTRTSSTEVNGLAGYIETGSTGASFGGRAGFPNTTSTSLLSNATINSNGGFHSLRGQRTQIYVFETPSVSTGITSTMISYTGTSNLLPLYLEFSGTSVGSSFLRGRNAAGGSSSGTQEYNTGDHTVLGVGNAIPATLEWDTRYLYVITYDETTEILTHRWKKTGDSTTGGSGFSYLSYQKDPADGPTSGTYNIYYMINSKSGFASAARPVKHRFHGLSHSLLSDSDFINIAGIIGI